MIVRNVYGTQYESDITFRAMCVWIRKKKIKRTESDRCVQARMACEMDMGEGISSAEYVPQTIYNVPAKGTQRDNFFFNF